MKPLYLAAFAAVGVLGCLGAAGGYYSWTRSPKCSLKAVAAALEHRDRYQFEKHVDMDSLLGSLVPENAATTPLGGAITVGMVAQLKPRLIKAVEEGTLGPDSYLGRVAATITENADIPVEKQGRNAYFSVKVNTKGGVPFPLRVHMTQVPDGFWKIDRFANIAELRNLEELEDAVAKATHEKEIADTLAKLKLVAKLHTSVEVDGDAKNRFQLRFQNGATKAVTAMQGKIRVPSASFEHRIEATLDLAVGATGNAVWEWDVNRFMPETTKLYSLRETDQFEVDVTSVTFTGGEKVSVGD